MTGTVHVVGAGLAGLAASIRLAQRGTRVVLHEASGQAGGRCRSYHDPALDMMIDNGNHLLLSGNHAALAYLDAIGAQDRLAGPAQAELAFIDLAGGERWTLRINASRLPWWICDGKRRVPGTSTLEYLSFARLLGGCGGKTICECTRCEGPLYERLARPLWLAALNTEPKEASAALAGAIVRETLAAGGRACRPLIARDGLGHAFIEPALRFLAEHGVSVEFGRRLRALRFVADRVAGLDFGEDGAALEPRRSRRSHGAATGGCWPGARSANSVGIPRHRQCTLPPRATRSGCTDHRGAQWHHRMAVRVSR